MNEIKEHEIMVMNHPEHGRMIYFRINGQYYLYPPEICRLFGYELHGGSKKRLGNAGPLVTLYNKEMYDKYKTVYESITKNKAPGCHSFRLVEMSVLKSYLSSLKRKRKRTEYARQKLSECISIIEQNNKTQDNINSKEIAESPNIYIETTSQTTSDVLKEANVKEKYKAVFENILADIEARDKSIFALKEKIKELEWKINQLEKAIKSVEQTKAEEFREKAKNLFESFMAI